MVQVLECMYVRQAVDVLEGLLKSNEECKDLPQGHLQKLIIFAMMWSLGALLELDDRKKVHSVTIYRYRDHLSLVTSISCSVLLYERTI